MGILDFGFVYTIPETNLPQTKKRQGKKTPILTGIITENELVATTTTQ